MPQRPPGRQLGTSVPGARSSDAAGGARRQPLAAARHRDHTGVGGGEAAVGKQRIGRGDDGHIAPSAASTRLCSSRSAGPARLRLMIWAPFSSA
jgi:hypothetical protein